ncbi:3'-5' exoribonuclease domain-containing protein [Escherichia coli]
MNSLFRSGGNGANFDNVILRRSYERQGSPARGATATIAMYASNQLGKAIDLDARTRISFEGERHNALMTPVTRQNTFQQSGKN